MIRSVRVETSLLFTNSDMTVIKLFITLNQVHSIWAVMLLLGVRVSVHDLLIVDGELKKVILGDFS